MYDKHFALKSIKVLNFNNKKLKWYLSHILREKFLQFSKNIKRD